MDLWCEPVQRGGTGFHTLIGKAYQLSYMRQWCEYVLDNLELLIENTRGAAPPRADDFCLSRDYPGTVPRKPEAMWERAMWRRWGPHGDGRPFLPICPHLQTYQYPLKLVEGDAKWGEIDLLGVGPDYRPVVVELKAPKSKDTVLRMLVEMVAYGVALRKAWPNLSEPHWREAMRRWTGDENSIPTDLGRVTLIGVAPPEYWARARGTDPADRSGRVPSDAWPYFCELAAEIGRRCDFSIHFAWVDEGPGDGEDAGTAGIGAAPSPFDGHPKPVRTGVVGLCP
jgi:hypothetical protein